MVSRKALQKWRNPLIESWINGLLDEQRPGRANQYLSKKRRSRVSATATHAGVTPYQVPRIRKAADLEPHRLKTSKISTDPQFAEKVVDVVGLYMNPHPAMQWS
jgi:hypothetical protein